MSTSIAPAPTYAEVILFDPDGSHPRFNPIWLKWFLELSTQVNTSAGTIPISHGGTGQTTLAAAQVALGIVWSNVYLAKTAAYTVAAADTGSTIALGGGAFYALTFGTLPGAYSSTFCVYVINTDNSAGSYRGKKIVLTGGTNYILWPGQEDVIYCVNGVWKSLLGPRRWQYGLGTSTVDTSSGSGTFFVDPAGDDTADGLGTATTNGAFATIAHALAVIFNQLDVSGQDTAHDGSFVWLKLKNSTTWTEKDATNTQGVFRFRSPWTGGGEFRIDGGGGTLAPSTGAAIWVESPMPLVTFQNVTLTSADHYGAVCSGESQLSFGASMTFGACSAGHLLSSGAGSIIYLGADYTISGSAVLHYAATQLGWIITDTACDGVTISGTPTFTIFAYVDRIGLLEHRAAITYTGAVTAGCIKFQQKDTSLIVPNGTTYPGSVAGTGVAWASYTPTITAASGTFTTVSGSMRYIQYGKTLHFSLQVVITTNGTAGTFVIFSLPVDTQTTHASSFIGRLSSGGALMGTTTGANTGGIVFYDGTYPGADGRTLYLSGTYEVA